MTAGPGSNPYANNRHADVLGVEPEDEPSKKRLCEEVKNRAKGAFQSKDMPSAELLYGKAIKLQESMEGSPVEATLHSNRSMVRLNLNKVEGALEDANKCIKIDPKFVKGYHRKAQALVRLSEWDDAIAAAEDGQKLDPENKAFQETIDKAKADKEKDAEEKVNLKRDAHDVRVELHNASTARQPPKVKKAENGAEDSSMRGYKKTADGKTTSFFHTDISDEAKALIAASGFGKPQKLDAPVEEAAGKGGGSTWNQAGTYEEKNMMKWLTDRLKEKLIGLEVGLSGSFAAEGGKVTATAVEEVKGDATISMSRGKRRHVLDLALEVHCECTVGGDTGKGKFYISEVNTGDDDREVKFEIDSSCPPNPRAAFKQFATSEVQASVIKALYEVVEEYKGK